jgi:hypothetical protein
MKLPDRQVAILAQCVTIHPAIDPKIDDCMEVKGYDDLKGVNTSHGHAAIGMWLARPKGTH